MPRALSEQQYDAIYTNNLIEHLIAPHLFLAKLWHLLKPGGLLAIGHPVVPPKIVHPIWKTIAGSDGFLASEHINFYTPETIKHTLCRSGFEVMSQVGVVLADGRFALAPSLSPSCLSICRKKEDFRYPKKRLQDFDPEFARPILQEWRKS